MNKSGKIGVVVSTLDNVDIRPGRFIGNSTRQVDFAIDSIFKGYKVSIRDHYEDGQHRVANALLFDRIIKRLESEHRLYALVDGSKHLGLSLNIDRKNLTIELVPINKND